MHKFIVLPLLVLLAACTDRGPIAPDGPDGPLFAKPKKCSDWPTCREGGDGGSGDGGNYLVQDLGTLGGSFSAATDINDNGDIVGRSRDADGNIMATLWAAPVKGTEYPLPTQVGDLNGYTGSYAQGINESGTVIVGEATPNLLTSEPIRWTLIAGGWSMEPLTLPTDAPNGIAYDVNNGSTAVGWTRVTGEPTAATFWLATGGAHLLPVDATGRNVAYGINDAGHIVGSYTSSSGPQAVLWMPLLGGQTSYKACDLNHGDDALYSGVRAVSEVMSDGGRDEIKILGSRTYEGGAHTIAVWTLDVSKPDADGCPTGSVQDIAGSWGYQPYDINGHGDIVGQDISHGGARPVVWMQGTLVELPSLKGNHGSAQGINNDGRMVGSSSAGGGSHAVLWTSNSNQ